jgi:hypothetical protein
MTTVTKELAIGLLALEVKDNIDAIRHHTWRQKFPAWTGFGGPSSVGEPTEYVMQAWYSGRYAVVFCDDFPGVYRTTRNFEIKSSGVRWNG